ncbi:MAG: hypothetical protein CMB13_04535 [Euryarchaeota archaeon]|nr:hypothetical protein [Euryarchaeota archaeon]
MSDKKRSGNRGKRRTNRQQGGSSEKKRSNLFKDLEKLAIHQIEEMLREVKSDIRSTEAQSESLRNERRQLIEIVTSLRESLKKGSADSKEKRSLRKQLSTFQNQRHEAQNFRDDANRRVPPVLDQIMDSLKHRHRLLTTMMNDLNEMPSLEDEIQLFQSFLEYQAMYEVKIQSMEAHKRMIAAIEGIRSIMKQFKEIDEKGKERKKNVAESTPRVEEENVGWSEVRRISSRIEEIDRMHRECRSDRGKLIRERGRLQAFLKIRESNSGRDRINPEEVKEKAASGGTLSISDLDTLLASGSLSEIGTVEQKESTTDGKRKRKRNRRTGASRSRPRETNLSRDRDQRGA